MMPVLFVSHGAPTVALEPEAPFGAALRAFGERVRPAAIAIVSAHWQTMSPSQVGAEHSPTRDGRMPEVRVTGAARPPLIYDFGGFPDEMYRMTYAAPGAPELAREIVDLLAGAHAVDDVPRWAAALDEARGWDHGAWVPLRLAYPAADVPVVQVSLPTAAPTALLAMGRALASLRADDVLVIGSGTVVHNLGAIGVDAPWAHAFDAWFADVIARHDLQELADWRTNAPMALRAHPTSEHFDPFLVAAGATEAGEPVTVLHDEIAFGSLSMRTFSVG